MTDERINKYLRSNTVYIVNPEQFKRMLENQDDLPDAARYMLGSLGGITFVQTVQKEKGGAE